MRRKACDYIKEEKMTPSELKARIRKDFGVSVGKVMISNSLADARKESRRESSSFGIISSFLDALSEANAGSFTDIQTENGVFRRAFVALGMCERLRPLYARSWP